MQISIENTIYFYHHKLRDVVVFLLVDILQPRHLLELSKKTPTFEDENIPPGAVVSGYLYVY